MHASAESRPQYLQHQSVGKLKAAQTNFVCSKYIPLHTACAPETIRMPSHFSIASCLSAPFSNSGWPTSYDSGTSRDIRKYLTPPCATLPLEGKLIVPLLFFFCYHSAPVLYKRQYCIVQHCKVVKRARVRLRFLQRNLGNSFTLLKAALLKTQALLHCKPKKLDGSRRIRCVERSHAGILSAVDVRQKRVCLR